MAQNLTINGVVYAFPETGEENWGDVVTAWAAAVSSGLLQKSGGAFTLTAEVDFGSSFGIKLPYIKDDAATIASAGFLRFPNNRSADGDLAWRNQADANDLWLYVDASDDLIFNQNGTPINISAASSGNVTGPGSAVDEQIAVFDGVTGQFLKDGGSTIADLGDVDGPGSSTDHAAARFDLATGKLLQDSTVIIDDSGNVSGVGTITMSGVSIAAASLATITASAAALEIAAATSLNLSAATHLILGGANLSKAAAPVADALYPNSMLKARAKLTLGGAGAVTVTNGLNVASAAWSTTDLTVTFHTNMADANYMIMSQPLVTSNGGVMNEKTLAVGSFILTTHLSLGGAERNWASGDVVNLLVFGEQ